MQAEKYHYKSGIYVITNAITKKVYIGSALYLRGRCAHHEKRLGLNAHKNTHLQAAWNKYGPDAFVFTILLYCDPTNLIFFEQRAIDGYMTRHGRSVLYNLTLVAGSNLGTKRSDETKAKMSISRRGILHSEETKRLFSETRKGRRLSPETKAKLSKVHKGRFVSEETKRKTSLALMGHKHSPETIEKIRATSKGRNKGRVVSPEVRAKMSLARMGVPLTPEHRASLSLAQKRRFARERQEKE
jgi:group I intron endonuclease